MSYARNNRSAAAARLYNSPPVAVKERLDGRRVTDVSDVRRLLMAYLEEADVVVVRRFRSTVGILLPLKLRSRWDEKERRRVARAAKKLVLAELARFVESCY